MNVPASARSTPYLIPWLVAAIAIGPGAARAAPTATMVVDLAASGPDVPDARLAQLTRALRHGVERAGDPLLPATSGADLLAISGCASADDIACLAAASGELGVERIVLGTVRRDGYATIVALVRIDRGGETARREVRLRARGGLEMASGRVPHATALVRGEPPPVAAAPEPAAPAVAPTPAAATAAPGWSSGEVAPWTWGVAGGGLALTAVGLVLLGAARGVQGDVDDASVDSGADLERLADLEARGRGLTRWGNVSLVAGGVAMAVGAVLVFRTGRDRDRAPIAISPFAVERGAGVALSFGGRR